MKQPKRQLGVLDLAHQFLRAQIRPGDFCIDATCGRGHDTKLLCELTGSDGRVLGFDIQQEAIGSAQKLLAEHGLHAELILDSHANMEQYAEAESVSCIVFNFGWLPRGDHSVFTKADSSIAALTAALHLLKPGGWLSLCIYYGGVNGYSERDAIDAFLASLDSRFYTVLQCRFPNRTGDPPYAVFVQKEESPCVS
ncbi:MAG: methyltransferase domain-containing protein [Oscillospiraceae bacterium]|nr:methyltransferase domain-containing protein [Oscillospiraceae bacterium]